MSRDINGAQVVGPWTETCEPPYAEQNLALLRHATWVHLREIHTAQHDIEASFALPPLFARPERPAPAPSAPAYATEDVEDELEDRFWAEEEKQFDRLMRGRAMCNRRFGAQGFISAGRMRATARHPPRANKASRSGNPGSSQQNSARIGMQSSKEPAASASGRRKKKVKKKSRAGLAAAAAAAAAAVATATATTATPAETTSLTLAEAEAGAEIAEIFAIVGSKASEGRSVVGMPSASGSNV